MKASSLIGAVVGAVVKVACTVLVIMLIYRGTMICYDYGYRIFTEPAVSQGEGRVVAVTIPKGMSAKEMGELFVNKGLIKDSTLFVLQYYLSEFREKIQPGDFELSTAMTAEEMMEVMATPQEKEQS